MCIGLPIFDSYFCLIGVKNARSFFQINEAPERALGQTDTQAGIPASLLRNWLVTLTCIES